MLIGIDLRASEQVAHHFVQLDLESLHRRRLHSPPRITEGAAAKRPPEGLPPRGIFPAVQLQTE